MKVFKTNLPIYILLGISIFFALYTKFKEQEVQRELKNIKLRDAAILLKDSILEHRLQSVDSLLFVGKYENALHAYTEELDTLAERDKDFVKFRINLVKKIMNDQELKKEAIIRNTKSYQANTLLSSKLKSSSDISLDSLRLAFTKTKRELKYVRNQLKTKSSGEYLQFKNPKRHKIHYVGNTSKGKANGYGIAIYDTGSRYEGEWRNNLREGKGSFYWTDGEYYIGEYKKDMRTGKGTYFWPNGEKYVGEWKKNKRHGRGVFYTKKGKVMTSGIWKKDKLVKEDKKVKKQ